MDRRAAACRPGHDRPRLDDRAGRAGHALRFDPPLSTARPGQPVASQVVPHDARLVSWGRGDNHEIGARLKCFDLQTSSPVLTGNTAAPRGGRRRGRAPGSPDRVNRKPEEQWGSSHRAFRGMGHSPTGAGGDQWGCAGRRRCEGDRAGPGRANSDARAGRDGGRGFVNARRCDVIGDDSM